MRYQALTIPARRPWRHQFAPQASMGQCPFNQRQDFFRFCTDLNKRASINSQIMCPANA